MQVLELKEEFSKFDDKKKGELEVDQAMRLLEARHETKTYTELRELLKSIDQNSNNLLSLLEWLCAFFNKSWETLTTPDAEVDVEAIKAELMAEAKKKEEEAQAAELEYQRARVQSMAVKEASAAAKQARLEAEKEMTGVKANAFFTRIAEESQEDANSNMTIEQQVKHEAALRKEKKRIKEQEELARKEREEAEIKAAQIAEEELKKAGVEKEKAYEEEKARVAAEEEAKKQKEADERAASRARLKERMKMFEQN